MHYHGSRQGSNFLERLRDLSDEYQKMEHDLATQKRQKEDYVRKLESQLVETQAMKQTLVDLEVNYNNMMKQYQEKIRRLKEKLGEEVTNEDFVVEPPLKKQKSRMEDSPSDRTSHGVPRYPYAPPTNPPHQHTARPETHPQSFHGGSWNTGNRQQPGYPYGGGTHPVRSAVSPHEPYARQPRYTDVSAEDLITQEGEDWVVCRNPNKTEPILKFSLLHNLKHDSVVCSVNFSPDGKYLATGSNRISIVFDVSTGEIVREFPHSNSQEDKYVRCVVFSPDGKYLAAGAEDKTLKIWDFSTGECVYTLTDHQMDIYSVDFSPDSKFLASASGDGIAKIWEVDSGKCIHTLGNEEIGPKDGLTSIAFSKDGKILAGASLDCVVWLWDVATGKCFEGLKGHEDAVYSVAFSPDDKTLLTASLDKTLKVWDLTSQKPECISTLEGHRDFVLSCAFSQDNKWLISSSKDRSVQFWDPKTYQLCLMLQGHQNSVISVAVNDKMQCIATGSGDDRCRIWRWD